MHSNCNCRKYSDEGTVKDYYFSYVASVSNNIHLIEMIYEQSIKFKSHEQVIAETLENKI